MKTLFGVIAFFFMCGMAWSASNVTLAWDPSTDVDNNLAGYNVYASQTSGVYTDPPVATTAVGIETATITLDPGIWYIVVTAYDETDLESGYSNEVSPSVEMNPPGTPPNVVITIIIKVE